MLKMTSLVIGLLVVAFSWNDIKSATVPGHSPKSNKEKSPQTQPGDLQVNPGVTIINKWEVPEVLTEISGIAYIDGDRFACVQDESGRIFIFNTATSDIEKEVPFGAPGDYEGLTLVNETAWVIRSDGHLFEVKGIDTEKPEVTEYSTPLTIEQNVEGLCYDKNNNRLLLAIKETEPGHADYKGIYGFDLGTRQMHAEPLFKIDLHHKIFTEQGAKNKGKNREIMPSAIAIHPVTGDMYIADGRNAKLLVIASSGELKQLYDLDSNEFKQPEGITFKPSGEMFISNEGVKNPGTILRVEVNER